MWYRTLEYKSDFPQYPTLACRISTSISAYHRLSTPDHLLSTPDSCPTDPRLRLSTSSATFDTRSIRRPPLLPPLTSPSLLSPSLHPAPLVYPRLTLAPSDLLHTPALQVYQHLTKRRPWSVSSPDKLLSRFPPDA